MKKESLNVEKTLKESADMLNYRYDSRDINPTYRINFADSAIEMFDDALKDGFIYGYLTENEIRKIYFAFFDTFSEKLNTLSDISYEQVMRFLYSPEADKNLSDSICKTANSNASIVNQLIKRINLYDEYDVKFSDIDDAIFSFFEFVENLEDFGFLDSEMSQVMIRLFWNKVDVFGYLLRYIDWFEEIPSFRYCLK